MAGKAKLRYQVTNWREYNESLVRRGDVTLWFEASVIDAWEHDNATSKVGRPFTYSDVAVETLLTLRELFRLPYRQTEGLGRALAKLMEADVAIPDFTSLAKRATKLGVSLDVRQAQGPIDVVVDSTLTASEPSTVIEVDGDQISLIRLGAGPIDGLTDEN